ncbi:MAG TPA: head protein [Myxococcaceae bacterium]|nr:head protein [Myxococcaceae bacterium]
MSTRKLTSKALEFLVALRANPQFKDQQEVLDVIFDALLFIDSTGQIYTFEDYRKHLVSDDPPRVVAAFDTLEEGKAWLKEHPDPPSSAYVLIAGQYHQLVYNRELSHRRVFPHPVLEYYLGGRISDGLPPAVASFATRQEAEAWFKHEAVPPKQVVIQIADEPYLAVYHANINHRSIYPFSMAIKVDEAEKSQRGMAEEPLE